MSVTKDGKLVIYCDRIKSMYICDSTSAEKDYRFPLPLKNDIRELSFTVSDQNKIIYTFLKDSDDKYFAQHIITMDGKLKREVGLQVLATYLGLNFLNVVFDHINKRVLVSLQINDAYSSDSDCGYYYNTRGHISLFIFSKIGELLHELKLPRWNRHRLTSHPKGPIAVVNGERVMMLHM